MKKILLIITITLSLIAAFQISAYAKETANAIDDYNKIFQEIDNQTQGLLDDIGLNDFKAEDLLNLSPRRIIDLIINLIKGSWRKPIEAAGTVLAITMLSTIINAVNVSNQRNENLYSFFTTTIVSVTYIIPISSAITTAISAVKLLSDFMILYVPIFTATISASGLTVSSLTYSGSILAFAEISSKLSLNLIVPLVISLTIFSVFSSINTNVDFSEFIAFVKKIVTISLSLIAGIFTGLIALKSKIAVATDSIAVKGIKLLSGSVIPIVGGAVGDAFTSVLGSFALIKNTIGSFGIVIIILIVLPPLINLLMWYFSIEICSAFCKLTVNSSLEKALKSMEVSITLVNIILIFFATVFIVTTGIMIDLKG